MGRQKLLREIEQNQKAVEAALFNGEILPDQAEDLQKHYDALLEFEEERHRVAVENFKKSSKKWRRNFLHVIKKQSV